MIQRPHPARVYIKVRGHVPNCVSREEIPGYPGETWFDVDQAARARTRGLSDVGSLSRLLEPIREELGAKRRKGKTPLSEDQIREAAAEYKRLYGRDPTQGSREPVPGLPGETWSGINAAGKDGYRGLTKGRTLPVMLSDISDGSNGNIAED